MWTPAIPPNARPTARPRQTSSAGRPGGASPHKGQSCAPHRRPARPPGTRRTLPRTNRGRGGTETAGRSVCTEARATAVNSPSRPGRCAAIRRSKAHLRKGSNPWERQRQEHPPGTPEGVKAGESRGQIPGRKQTSQGGNPKLTKAGLDLAFPGTRCSGAPTALPPAAFAGLLPRTPRIVRTCPLSCARAPHSRVAAPGDSRRSGETGTLWYRSSRPCRQYLAWPLRRPRAHLAKTWSLDATVPPVWSGGASCSIQLSSYPCATLFPPRAVRALKIVRVVSRNCQAGSGSALCTGGLCRRT